MDLSPAQRLALLFHDAVYVPGTAAGMNESMSVSLMYAIASDLDRDLLDQAAGAIRDTERHIATSHASARVLDLDLAPLADPPHQFAEWTRRVFEENRLLLPADENAARDIFHRRRKQMLRRLAARATIYTSPETSLVREQDARRNIQRYCDGQSM